MSEKASKARPASFVISQHTNHLAQVEGDVVVFRLLPVSEWPLLNKEETAKARDGTVRLGRPRS